MPRKKVQPSTEQRFYSISVVSRMLNTHPQTLRMYERLGLIKPRRNERGDRLFSEEDIERVRKIQELTQRMGVNLAGVEVAFKLMARIEELEAELNHEESVFGKQFKSRQSNWQRNWSLKGGRSLSAAVFSCPSLAACTHSEACQNFCHTTKPEGNLTFEGAKKPMRERTAWREILLWLIGV